VRGEGSYTAGGGEGAVYVEETYCVLDWAGFEGRIHAGCFGVRHGGEFETVP